MSVVEKRDSNRLFFFSVKKKKKKVGKFGRKRCADLSRFLSSINRPYILRKEKRKNERNLVVHTALTRDIRRFRISGIRYRMKLGER